MYCPFCNATDTKVIDSRLASDGAQVRRRRQCQRCDERFTTYEIAELGMPYVVKRDGSRVPFFEDKLRSGIQKALEKRPVDTDRIEALVNRVKMRMRACGEREVSSRVLGEWVMTELRDLDQVAYVRFASVYRSFQDVNAFREEVERLQQEPSPEMKQRQFPLLPDEEGQ